MTHIPATWVLCTIADVTAPVQTIDAAKSQDRDILYVDISSIDNIANRIAEPKRLRLSSAPSRARQVVKSGDVLFATVRPYLRNIAQVPESLDGEIASTGFSVLRAVDGVIPSYLFYKSISRDFVAALTGEQYGVSYPAVKDNQVRAQPFELPPTNEQRRIVAKIEELFSEIDKGVESLKTAQEQLTAYRQAFLKHAFEGMLTADWRTKHSNKLETSNTVLANVRAERAARYAAATDEWHQAVADWRAAGQVGKKPTNPERILDQPDITPEELNSLPPLPPSWAWVRLGELFSSSPQNGLYKPASGYGSGTPIIRIDSFYDGALTRDVEFKRLKLSPDEIRKYLVEHGDLLINRVNSIEYLGKCALVTNLTEQTVFESNIMKLSILSSNLNGAYIAYFLSSHGGRSRLCRNAKHAVNQASINQTDVALTPIPLPPIAEQREIIGLVDKALTQTEMLASELAHQGRRSEALRQSILKRAFSGQLAVQELNDEPASALLNCIRAGNEVGNNGRKKIKTVNGKEAA
ncbi:restriction endonuclease subunit S [Bradyrhizobium sp. CCGUVB1N3]|uniref:restriction endonuclease subunit S n=1 Tax=Bradyrhizobium sp. CCGUVB1N3 TaxID=2949629 RepID=UPI0020B28189|nr:restriction endonuclease subunit S [Bradyrhizobium sp. CCGUVB1N3]MCP3475839.1 restriction endonuclease subunit S [Bradyrhizobium sp. CCGUVB1N3]